MTYYFVKDIGNTSKIWIPRVPIMSEKPKKQTVSNSKKTMKWWDLLLFILMCKSKLRTSCAL